MFWTFFRTVKYHGMAWKKMQKGKKIQSLKNLLEFLPFCSNIEILLKTLKQIFQLNYENSTFFFVSFQERWIDLKNYRWTKIFFGLLTSLVKNKCITKLPNFSLSGNIW